MQQIPVSSSLIASAAYDDQAMALSITFKSGATWAYGNAAQPFTAQDLADFRSAGSQGKHFLQLIKGSYPERRV